MIIYDCEILNAIPGGKQIPGIYYCEGWEDYRGMGISCIGAFDYEQERYRVFCQDNLREFQELINAGRIMVGFNNIRFDNHLLRANDFKIEDAKCIDLLQNVWGAFGLPPVYNKEIRAGYGLNALCKANFMISKTGHGANAPVDWQQGRIGTVIDYCLNDIRLTKKLYEKIALTGSIINPKTGREARVILG